MENLSMSRVIRNKYSFDELKKNVYDKNLRWSDTNQLSNITQSPQSYICILGDVQSIMCPIGQLRLLKLSFDGVFEFQEFLDGSC